MNSPNAAADIDHGAGTAPSVAGGTMWARGALLHDDMFRYGQELYEFGYGLQKAVNLGPASCGAGVDGSKDVVLDTMSAHHVDRLHDAVEGTLAAAVAAEGVMYVSAGRRARPL